VRNPRLADMDTVMMRGTVHGKSHYSTVHEHPGLAPGKMNLIGVLSWKHYILSMNRLTLAIVVEADADGYFDSCPALQGCYSEGDTYEKAVENIKDAIRLHIEDRLGRPVAHP
jgi:predicted RNase H-like HicB family nuclease